METFEHNLFEQWKLLNISIRQTSTTTVGFCAGILTRRSYMPAKPYGCCGSLPCAYILYALLQNAKTVPLNQLRLGNQTV